MKSVFQLGQEARDRLTNIDLNPFKSDSFRGWNWESGWIDRDWQLFKESGLTRPEWDRLIGVKLK